MRKRNNPLHVFLVCVLAALVVGALPTTSALAQGNLEDLFKVYDPNNPAHNARLWRSLQRLRHMPDVPKHVVDGFNAFRLKKVADVRLDVVRKIMKDPAFAGQIGDLKGFLTTGSGGGRGARPLRLRSDVDFSLVSKNKALQQKFRELFYEQLGADIGIRATHVPSRLDVNCYDLLKSVDQTGYRSVGGRKFALTYSIQTGEFHLLQISGGAVSTVRRVATDISILLDIPIPKLKPGEAVGFAKELNDLAKLLPKKYGFCHINAVRDHAKLAERSNIARSVATGQPRKMDFGVLKQADAIRNRGIDAFDDIFAARIRELRNLGYSLPKARNLAAEEFNISVRKYAEKAAVDSANRFLQVRSPQMNAFRRFLAKVNMGHLLKGGTAALVAYDAYRSYQEEGASGMYFSLLKNGVYIAAGATLSQIVLAEITLKVGREMAVVAKDLLDYSAGVTRDVLLSASAREKSVLKAVFGIASGDDEAAVYRKIRDRVMSVRGNPKEAIHAWVEDAWEGGTRKRYFQLYRGQAVHQDALKASVERQVVAIFGQVRKLERARAKKQLIRRYIDRRVEEEIRKERMRAIDALELRFYEEEHNLCSGMMAITGFEGDELYERLGTAEKTVSLTYPGRISTKDGGKARAKSPTDEKPAALKLSCGLFEKDVKGNPTDKYSIEYGYELTFAAEPAELDLGGRKAGDKVGELRIRSQQSSIAGGAASPVGCASRKLKIVFSPLQARLFEAGREHRFELPHTCTIHDEDDAGPEFDLKVPLILRRDPEAIRQGSQRLVLNGRIEAAGYGGRVEDLKYCAIGGETPWPFRLIYTINGPAKDAATRK